MAAWEARGNIVTSARLSVRRICCAFRLSVNTSGIRVTYQDVEYEGPSEDDEDGDDGE
jgi:hypothetical protein